MIRDFITQINLKLGELIDIESRYKTTSLTDNYIVFDVDVFDSTDGKVVGQIVMDVKYADIMKLLEVQDNAKDLLDRWTYISDKTFASVYFSIINDLSKKMNKQYWHELRFDFTLRRNG